VPATIVARAPLLAIALVWVVAALLVQPWGEFPLNDDWDYAKSARAIVERGRFELSPEARVTLVAQAAWGAVFSLPFGWSFFALRLSTLVAGLGGTLAVYGLARLVGASRGIATVAALAFALCPLTVGLAFTFMTDVPYASALAVGLLALGGWLQRGGWVALLAGAALAVVAVLIRPTGLALPVAFLLAALLSRQRGALLGAALVLGLAAGALALWQVWAVLAGLGGLANPQAGELRDALARAPLSVGGEVARQSGIAAFYLGLFLLPLSLVGGAASGQRGLLVAAGGGLIGLGLAVVGARMPLAINVLYDLGLGPLTLRDAFLVAAPPETRGPAWVAGGATVLAGGGAAVGILLVARGGLRLWRCGARPLLALVTGTALIAFVPFAVAGFLDRYLIALLPPLLALGAAGARRSSRTALASAAITLLLLGGFGVVATRDYFAWNRARWTALERLQERGVTPAEIDGGFEFNGWLTYDPRYRRDPMKSWWWVMDDRYVAAFGPLPGYREVDREPFWRWLPPHEGAVLILERAQ
jgi:4-amino-4-deoxy-L-arabinose transferase-like glycosyltransferase